MQLSSSSGTGSANSSSSDSNSKCDHHSGSNVTSISSISSSSSSSSSTRGSNKPYDHVAAVAPPPPLVAGTSTGTTGTDASADDAEREDASTAAEEGDEVGQQQQAMHVHIQQLLSSPSLSAADDPADAYFSLSRSLIQQHALLRQQQQQQGRTAASTCYTVVMHAAAACGIIFIVLIGCVLASTNLFGIGTVAGGLSVNDHHRTMSSSSSGGSSSSGTGSSMLDAFLSQWFHPRDTQRVVHLQQQQRQGQHPGSGDEGIATTAHERAHISESTAPGASCPSSSSSSPSSPEFYSASSASIPLLRPRESFSSVFCKGMGDDFVPTDIIRPASSSGCGTASGSNFGTGIKPTTTCLLSNVLFRDGVFYLFPDEEPDEHEETTTVTQTATATAAAAAAAASTGPSASLARATAARSPHAHRTVPRSLPSDKVAAASATSSSSSSSFLHLVGSFDHIHDVSHLSDHFLSIKAGLPDPHNALHWARVRMASQEMRTRFLKGEFEDSYIPTTEPEPATTAAGAAAAEEAASSHNDKPSLSVLFSPYWPENQGHQLFDESLPIYQALLEMGLKLPATQTRLVMLESCSTIHYWRFAGGSEKAIRCWKFYRERSHVLSSLPFITLLQAENGTDPVWSQKYINGGGVMFTNVLVGVAPFSFSTNDASRKSLVWQSYRHQYLTNLGLIEPAVIKTGSNSVNGIGVGGGGGIGVTGSDGGGTTILRPHSMSILVIQKRGFERRVIRNTELLAQTLHRRFQIPVRVIEGGSLSHREELELLLTSPIVITPSGGVSMLLAFLDVRSSAIIFDYLTPGLDATWAVDPHTQLLSIPIATRTPPLSASLEGWWWSVLRPFQYYAYHWNTSWTGEHSEIRCPSILSDAGGFVSPSIEASRPLRFNSLHPMQTGDHRTATSLTLIQTTWILKMQCDFEIDLQATQIYRLVQAAMRRSRRMWKL